MSLKSLKQEESIRFYKSPLVYSISLFIFCFGLSVSVWNLIDFIAVAILPWHYSFISFTALIMSVIILLLLDKEKFPLNTRGDEVNNTYKNNN